MGVIYILTNPAFPEYVKIGYADNLEQRLKQLNRSECIPFAFRVYAVYKTEQRLKDLDLHFLIDKLNPDLRSIDEFDGEKRIREFYAMPTEDAYTLLECIAKISGTEDRLNKMKPEGHEILDEQEADDIRKEIKKGPFRFGEYEIPIGSQLQYTKDENIIAKTVDDKNKVEYNGEVMSISSLAKTLLKNVKSAQGAAYFKYEGELLTDRRKRMDGE